MPRAMSEEDPGCSVHREAVRAVRGSGTDQLLETAASHFTWGDECAFCDVCILARRYARTQRPDPGRQAIDPTRAAALWDALESAVRIRHGPN